MNSKQYAEKSRRALDIAIEVTELERRLFALEQGGLDLSREYIDILSEIRILERDRHFLLMATFKHDSFNLFVLEQRMAERKEAKVRERVAKKRRGELARTRMDKLLSSS